MLNIAVNWPPPVATPYPASRDRGCLLFPRPPGRLYDFINTGALISQRAPSTTLTLPPIAASPFHHFVVPPPPYAGVGKSFFWGEKSPNPAPDPRSQPLYGCTPQYSREISPLHCVTVEMTVWSLRPAD